MKVLVTIRTASVTLVKQAEIEAGSTFAALLQMVQPGSVAARHLVDLPHAALAISVMPAMGTPETLTQEANGVGV